MKSGTHGGLVLLAVVLTACTGSTSADDRACAVAVDMVSDGGDLESAEADARALDVEAIEDDGIGEAATLTATAAQLVEDASTPDQLREARKVFLGALSELARECEKKR